MPRTAGSQEPEHFPDLLSFASPGRVAVPKPRCECGTARQNFFAKRRMRDQKAVTPLLLQRSLRSSRVRLESVWSLQTLQKETNMQNHLCAPILGASFILFQSAEAAADRLADCLQEDAGSMPNFRNI